MLDKFLSLTGKFKRIETLPKINDTEAKVLRCVGAGGVSEDGIKQKYNRLYPNKVFVKTERIHEQKISIHKIILSLIEKGCLMEGVDERTQEKTYLFYLTHLGNEVINKKKWGAI